MNTTFGMLFPWRKVCVHGTYTPLFVMIILMTYLKYFNFVRSLGTSEEPLHSIFNISMSSIVQTYYNARFDACRSRKLRISGYLDIRGIGLDDQLEDVMFIKSSIASHPGPNDFNPRQ